MSKWILTLLAAVHTIIVVYIVYILAPGAVLALAYSAMSTSYMVIGLIDLVLIAICGISAGLVWLCLKRKSLSALQSVVIVAPYIIISLFYSSGNLFW